ncbi:longitudinals lacking protein, isoforms A/B/D/L-like [Anoplophora glabripennis]|uniref:longitudinals lacking protein, isoforms A/B/D/L-like n=1 Tax=Anoplophora glabripennis TaxID=217634 RepID=UPI000C771B52|nr:longitudinals lacking protein, isoforms A/B/D/L-like [Anoplophora glabripennis]
MKIIGGFRCEQCGKWYKTKNNLGRHLKYECQRDPKFQCTYCSYRAKLNCNLLKHIRSQHLM